MSSYQPDYSQWLESVWGWPDEAFGILPLLGGASNIVVGTNPPYGPLDFAALYPKFLGPALAFTGTTDGTTNQVRGLSGVQGIAVGNLLTGPGLPSSGLTVTGVAQGVLSPTGNLTEGSNVITGLSSTAGLYAGQLLAAVGVPAGTVIQTVNTIAGSLVMSNNATANASAESLTVSTVTLSLSGNTTAAATSTLTAYTQALVPLPVLNAYIYLATSSLVQARWCEGWLNGMGLFIAHYCTLWLQGEGTPASTAAQAAQQGIASGILVSKSADGLSAGFQPVQGIEEWGAWNLTRYGQLFATIAKGVGAGAMLLY